MRIRKYFIFTLVLVVFCAMFGESSTISAQNLSSRTRTESYIYRVTNSEPVEGGIGYSRAYEVTPDGNNILVMSNSPNLVANDNNNTSDIFVYDVEKDVFDRVSVSSSGLEANNTSLATPSLTSDGRYVIFASIANNLVDNDTNNLADLFFHDRIQGTTELAVPFATEWPGFDYAKPHISDDLRFVTFQTSQSLSSEHKRSREIYQYDRQNKTYKVLSPLRTEVRGGEELLLESVSPEGRYIGFSSDDNNLVSTDNNNLTDVFVTDTLVNQNRRISKSFSDGDSNSASTLLTSSYDSNKFVFRSQATNLVDPNPTGQQGLFYYDLKSDEMIKIDADGEWPIISANGSYVLYTSVFSDQLFVYDTKSKTKSENLYPDGIRPTESVFPAGITNDSATVIITTKAALEPSDVNHTEDVYILFPRVRQHFSLSGRVTDAGGAGIANARITNGLGQYVTSADGTYTITELPAGSYTITATLPGTNKKLVPSSRTVTVGPNATGVNFTEQVPIILVPGTGASMNMLCFFVSDDLCFNTWVTRLTWHWAPHPLIGKQVAGIYYEPLLEALRARGYTESSGYLEVFHYDWRKPAAANGQLLDQRIKDVLSNTGASRVDLITHSQGGLVARTYIQGPTYDNTVRNVFFAGVPHQGVTKSYYFWEGGQVVAGDSRMQNEVLQLLINQVYKEDLENQTTMFRRVFPSFQGMLPTYNYLRRNNELVQNNTLVWQNTTLPALNDTSGLLFGRTTVYNFVGTGIQTRQLLTLGDANPSLSTWPDGQVIGENLDKLGDGTVTQKSATLDMVDRQIEVASTHSNILLNSTTQSVIFGVLGLPVPQVEVHTAATTKAQETNFLYVAISGTVDITVTNTLGQYVSKTGTTISDAVYVQSAGYPRQMVLVPHSTGTYTVTVGAESAGTPYSLGVLISAAAEQYTGTFFDAWDTEQVVYTPNQQFVITHDGTSIDQTVPHTSTVSVFLPLIKR